jgi:hypothetical protein
MTPALQIRDIRQDEFGTFGRLLGDVYSSLEGFPTPTDQPKYYQILAKGKGRLVIRSVSTKQRPRPKTA